MKRLVVKYWVLVVVWLVVIFIFSTDLFAIGETFRYIVPLLRFFFPSLSPRQLEFWHAVIRKLGHVTEYFILALFTYRSFRQQPLPFTRALVLTFIFVAIAASFDEVHQGFTLFRGASPIDVGYDCLGAFGALLLIWTYETRRIRTHPLL